MNQENRKCLRKDTNAPVQLEICNQGSKKKKTLFGYACDYSQEGMQLLISEECTLKNSDVTLYWQIEQTPQKIPAKIIWQKNHHYGLAFSEEPLEDKPLFPEFSLQSLPEQIQTFGLFVNGQEVLNTPFEYVPLAHQQICNPDHVREYLFQIKRGHFPLDAQNIIYGRYPLAKAQLNFAAIHAAQDAFLEFKKVSIHRKIELLNLCFEALQKNKSKLLELWIAEGFNETLSQWQFQNIAEILSKQSLDEISQWVLNFPQAKNEKNLIFLRRPGGVCCIESEINPADCAGIAVAALLCGNSLVLAANKKMPLSTIYLWKEIFAKTMIAAGAPKGLINIISGQSSNLLSAWIKSPDVQHIFSSASFAQVPPKTQTLPSGLQKLHCVNTSDVICVWKDANIEAAAQSLLDSFLASSQILHIPKKALIHPAIYSQFIKIFVPMVKSLNVGLPNSPTRLCATEKTAEFFNALDDALLNDAQVLTGGFRLNHHGKRDDSGTYLAPTVLECRIEKVHKIRCLHTEQFFPLLPLVRLDFGSLKNNKEQDRTIFEQVQQFLSDHHPQLRLSIWVQNQFYMQRFIEEFDYAQTLRFNQSHTNFSLMNDPEKFRDSLKEFYPFWLKTSNLQSIFIS